MSNNKKNKLQLDEISARLAARYLVRRGTLKVDPKKSSFQYPSDEFAELESTVKSAMRNAEGRGHWTADEIGLVRRYQNMKKGTEHALNRISQKVYKKKKSTSADVLNSIKQQLGDAETTKGLEDKAIGKTLSIKQQIQKYKEYITTPAADPLSRSQDYVSSQQARAQLDRFMTRKKTFVPSSEEIAAARKAQERLDRIAELKKRRDELRQARAAAAAKAATPAEATPKKQIGPNTITLKGTNRLAFFKRKRDLGEGAISAFGSRHAKAIALTGATAGALFATAPAYKESRRKMKKIDKMLNTNLTKEEAPPGAKYERMVMHIKGDNPSKRQKEVAYATAWKAYNKDHGISENRLAIAAGSAIAGGGLGMLAGRRMERKKIVGGLAGSLKNGSMIMHVRDKKTGKYVRIMPEGKAWDTAKKYGKVGAKVGAVAGGLVGAHYGYTQGGVSDALIGGALGAAGGAGKGAAIGAGVGGVAGHIASKRQSLDAARARTRGFHAKEGWVPGAIAGGALGSIVPGVGTATGAALGGGAQYLYDKRQERKMKRLKRLTGHKTTTSEGWVTGALAGGALGSVIGPVGAIPGAALGGSAQALYDRHHKRKLDKLRIQRKIQRNRVQQEGINPRAIRVLKRLAGYGGIGFIGGVGAESAAQRKLDSIAGKKAARTRKRNMKEDKQYFKFKNKQGKVYSNVGTGALTAAALTLPFGSMRFGNIARRAAIGAGIGAAISGRANVHNSKVWAARARQASKTRAFKSELEKTTPQLKGYSLRKEGRIVGKTAATILKKITSTPGKAYKMLPSGVKKPRANLIRGLTQRMMATEGKSDRNLIMKSAAAGALWNGALMGGAGALTGRFIPGGSMKIAAKAGAIGAGIGMVHGAIDGAAIGTGVRVFDRVGTDTKTRAANRRLKGNQKMNKEDIDSLAKLLSKDSSWGDQGTSPMQYIDEWGPAALAIGNAARAAVSGAARVGSAIKTAATSAKARTALAAAEVGSAAKNVSDSVKSKASQEFNAAKGVVKAHPGKVGAAVGLGAGVGYAAGSRNREDDVQESVVDDAATVAKKGKRLFNRTSRTTTKDVAYAWDHPVLGGAKIAANPVIRPYKKAVKAGLVGLSGIGGYALGSALMASHEVKGNPINEEIKTAGPIRDLPTQSFTRKVKK